MTRFLLLLATAALAVAGCHKNGGSAPGNDATTNITTVDANAMPEDANVTDIPADDGDAPAETNAK